MTSTVIKDITETNEDSDSDFESDDEERENRTENIGLDIVKGQFVNTKYIRDCGKQFGLKNPGPLCNRKYQLFVYIFEK